MVSLRTPTRPPSYVGKQRSDERPRFREAGFDYRPTLASNVVTMSFTSQCAETKSTTEAKYRLANSDCCFQPANCYSAGY
jgi:hypothetical protein